MPANILTMVRSVNSIGQSNFELHSSKIRISNHACITIYIRHLDGKGSFNLIHIPNKWINLKFWSTAFEVDRARKSPVRSISQNLLRSWYPSTCTIRHLKDHSSMAAFNQWSNKHMKCFQTLVALLASELMNPYLPRWPWWWPVLTIATAWVSQITSSRPGWSFL